MSEATSPATGITAEQQASSETLRLATMRESILEPEWAGVWGAGLTTEQGDWLCKELQGGLTIGANDLSRAGVIRALVQWMGKAPPVRATAGAGIEDPTKTFLAKHSGIPPSPNLQQRAATIFDVAHSAMRRAGFYDAAGDPQLIRRKDPPLGYSDT